MTLRDVRGLGAVLVLRWRRTLSMLLLIRMAVLAVAAVAPLPASADPFCMCARIAAIAAT